MNTPATLTGLEKDGHQPTPPLSRGMKKAPLPVQFTNHLLQEEATQRQAELFYLQKQIQSQTPMVIVLADGEHIEGCIEWYDRLALKVRGRSRVLIYKSAIKYMYKLGENAQ
ncbi:MAG TPA: RNA chaperone Hfq [Terracidiphilus sp.]|nr:RNA chaperone Hfq [Terracidiphilus sp.]